MKSNEEFISDILNKAEIIEAKQKRTRNILIRSGIGMFIFAMIISCAFTATHSNNIKTQTERELIESVKLEDEAKGFSLIANCDYGPQKEIKSNDKSYNISIPIGGFLDVTDTKAMSESEINKIAYELKLKLKKLYGENCEWKISGEDGEKAAVYFATAGKLKLILPESSEMESITLSCSENGEMTLFDLNKIITNKKLKEGCKVKSGSNVTVSLDEYKEMQSVCNGMSINWNPSKKLRGELFENPFTDISTVSDTITGEIKYNDGSYESFIISISFDSDGSLKAFYSYKSL